MNETKETFFQTGSEEPGRDLLVLVAALRARLNLDLELKRGISYLRMTEGIGTTQAARERGPAIEKDASTPTLQDIRREMEDCQRCPLCRTRTHLVFGEGSPRASLVFVGEAPGADEDAQGRPFVGRAGQLLNRIIEAMGMARSDVYICNILKCRPPDNRNPRPDEILSCEPFLVKQLQCLKPQVICALGTFAAHALLKTEIPITRLRGRFHAYQGIPLMPTYHPAYLLRNPGAKKQVWEDVQMIMKIL